MLCPVASCRGSDGMLLGNKQIITIRLCLLWLRWHSLGGPDHGIVQDLASPALLVSAGLFREYDGPVIKHPNEGTLINQDQAGYRTRSISKYSTSPN
jgi:hypothetical protein